MLEYANFVNAPQPVFMKFAEPIYTMLDSVLGIDRETAEQIKDVPRWGKKTLRDFMIAFSEDAVKPCMGQDGFGIMAANNLLNKLYLTDEYTVPDFGLNKHPEIAIVFWTDCRFPNEITGMYNEIQASHKDMGPIRQYIIALSLRRGGFDELAHPITRCNFSKFYQVTRHDVNNVPNDYAKTFENFMVAFLLSLKNFDMKHLLVDGTSKPFPIGK